MTVPTISIIQGDALEKLKELPDEYVHCVVTSPPYWGLRDYSVCDCSLKHHFSVSARIFDGSDRKESVNDNINPNDLRCKRQPDPDCPKCHGTGNIAIVKEHQIGLETNIDDYVSKLVEIFREVRRVLRSDGTLWLVIGDCYCGSGINDGTKNPGLSKGYLRNQPVKRPINHSLKPKDLVGVPWRVAFALQADGWYLRSDIIWSKPNMMPESVTDRPTKSHEYIFLMTKSSKYYYDQNAIRELYNSGNRFSEYGRNKRTVWTIAIKPYNGAHFATFPEEIPEICIRAGTSKKGCCSKCGAPYTPIVKKGDIDKDWIISSVGSLSPNTIAKKNYDGMKVQNASDVKKRILNSMRKLEIVGWKASCHCDAEIMPCVVLDPFAGSGTTGAVAKYLERSAILIELNPEYIALIEERTGVRHKPFEAFS